MGIVEFLFGARSKTDDAGNGGVAIVPNDPYQSSGYSRRDQATLNFVDKKIWQQAIAEIESKLSVDDSVHPGLKEEYLIMLRGERAQDGVLGVLSPEEIKRRQCLREKQFLMIQAKYPPYAAYNKNVMAMEYERQIHQMEQDSRSRIGSPILERLLQHESITLNENRSVMVQGNNPNQNNKEKKWF